MLTETTPPAAPLPETEVLDELGELELAGLLADDPGDKEPKLGRVALVPRTTSTCPAVTELLACAVTPNSAAILAALACAAAPDPDKTSVVAAVRRLHADFDTAEGLRQFVVPGQVHLGEVVDGLAGHRLDRGDLGGLTSLVGQQIALVPAHVRVDGPVQALRVGQAVGLVDLPLRLAVIRLGKVTQSSRGIEKPTPSARPRRCG